MNRIIFIIFSVPMILASCQSAGERETLATLNQMEIDINEEKIDGGLDKAMQSYKRFLEETPDSPLTPEAIRRLADLKIEKEYGTLTEGSEQARADVTHPKTGSETGGTSEPASVPAQAFKTPESDVERNMDLQQRTGAEKGSYKAIGETDDLERAGAREALGLYKKLLNDYPLYERNDQVLYQMSRAYEELGQVEEAMEVMERLVGNYPGSSYIDEVQFRRAEYFFSHKHYLDAEDAYGSIVNSGVASSYYELALYKLGWTFYKQELYDEALDRFVALLDHKVSVGYDFAQTDDEQARKRTEDTFRVISLSFTNLGGPKSVVEYFSHQGKRTYEDSVYSNLGEFYFDKRRYADAAATYNAFVERNPFHEKAPIFHMRVIEIQAAGGFPSLVLESKKKFAETYGLKSEYWNYFEPKDRNDVLGYLKTNLTDLANHYHACYQDPKQAKKKTENFQEALKWYRGFLISFPMESESPDINYQLAGLLLENFSFGEAAMEFEKTAYDYPIHKSASQAGYLAVTAYREEMNVVSPEELESVRRKVVGSSLKFADAFPEHDKASLVLGAAADDLFGMGEYEQALEAANKLINVFPSTENDLIRSAWLVIGHSSYELMRYSDAEKAYLNVLALVPEDDEKHSELVDNLAASIYKQGEEANASQDYQTAADHFLRVGRMAPTSKIRPTAEYDAAAALIQLKDWDTAASVLVGFRNNFPEHPLQPEVTKKIAYVYRENGKLSLAASEYERIERESEDENIRRDALLAAAELYEQDGVAAKALEVYRRYVTYFAKPVETNLESRNKIAGFLKDQNDEKSYLEELEKIVGIDASAGSDRTPRTRYLAAKAALVLAESEFDTFLSVKLENPIEVNLPKKRKLMKETTEKFSRLFDYEIGEITAASTFYLAEIYAHFSKALMASERPQGLSTEEREQYELALEEQAYPFEEKAIEVHESNLKLISLGVYNQWIDKSLQQLAETMPARYNKPEETSGIASSMETYLYAIERPNPPALEPEVLVDDEGPDYAPGSETVEPVQMEKIEPIPESESAKTVPEEEPVNAQEVKQAVPAQIPDKEPVTEPEAEAPGAEIVSSQETDQETWR